MQKVEVYVAENYHKSAKSMRILFNDPPANPAVVPPEEPTGADAESRLKITLHMDKVGRYHVAKDTLENTLHSLFTVLWGQCSPGIQGRLKGLNQFNQRKEVHDCSWLLEEIRQVMYNSSSGRYRLKVLYEAKLDILRFKQGRLGVNEYYDALMDRVDAFEYAGGDLGQDKGVLLYVEQYTEGLLDTDPGPVPVAPSAPALLELGGRNSFTAAEVEDLTLPLDEYISSVELFIADTNAWKHRKKGHEELRGKRGRDMFLGMLLLTNASDRYKELKDSLDDDYLKGNNTYPSTPEHALTMLSDHVLSNGNSHQNNDASRGHQNGHSSSGSSGRGRQNNSSNPRSGNVSFVQTGTVVQGTDGRTLPEVQCWSCQSFGHYQDQCPNAIQLLQTVGPPGNDGDDGEFGIDFNQVDMDSLPSKPHGHLSGRGVVMDTGSTINTIMDSEYLTNI